MPDRHESAPADLQTLPSLKVSHLASPDPSKVVLRPLRLSAEREQRLASMVEGLSDAEVSSTLERVFADYESRHPHPILEETLRRRGTDVAAGEFSTARLLLAGAYLCSEYSVEAAAVANPSLFRAPDGGWVVSLRSIGEGHISTVTFRTASLDAGRLSLEPWSGWLSSAAPEPTAGGARRVLSFPADAPVDTVALGPTGEADSHGLEDARFVSVETLDGEAELAATVTAFDGRNLRVDLIRTPDLHRFSIEPLSGPAAADKGLALFPSPVGGRSLAVSRFDGESLWLATESSPGFFEPVSRLGIPDLWWARTQLGNCGSPIFTPEGWLLPVHGVGVMREYTLGVLLLDLEDPSQVLASSTDPLVSPTASERDGYVPNVVYSCGGLVSDGWFVLPFAYADQRLASASVRLSELLVSLN